MPEVFVPPRVRVTVEMVLALTLVLLLESGTRRFRR
jgi:hypothetical protein